jgi:hypothetical protein
MGKVSRFMRKVSGRSGKLREGQSNVGAPRTAAVPPLSQIQQCTPAQTTISMAPSTSLGARPTMELPQLDPIQTLSPIRIPTVSGMPTSGWAPTAVPSLSPAPKFYLAYHSEPDEQSPATETFTEEESFQCQGLPASLPRENTNATIFHPPTPPLAPRLSSVSFARLPEYVGSSDGSEEDFEVPRTGHGTFSSDLDDTDFSDSPGLAMLRPLERPKEVDVFSSSSSPNVPRSSEGFALPGPPPYCALPTDERASPSRPSYRPSSVHMPDEPTPHRATYIGAMQQSHGRASRHRRTLTTYPPAVPNFQPSSSGATSASTSTTTHPAKIYVYPPHGFPPTPSFELQHKSSFSTRMEPLPSSTRLLPRTDDDGIDLQTVLMTRKLYSSDPKLSHSPLSSGDHSAASDENWVEYANERTPSEQEEAARAEHDNSESDLPNGEHQAWWENGSRNDQPQRDPYDRSGAHASFGFRSDE